MRSGSDFSQPRRINSLTRTYVLSPAGTSSRQSPLSIRLPTTQTGRTCASCSARYAARVIGGRDQSKGCEGDAVLLDRDADGGAVGEAEAAADADVKVDLNVGAAVGA
ncbi:hypothetical protein [Pandoraea sp. PE-S2T-3]|uniref:hypothetical protein n=1 Tax=Pandoraea sp. PE-S2T-3 TaxID=1986993 RepID=UPI001124CD9F|nr:hypothetical protein [Pandoraea sp. PE-S2T-3]